ncbi:MAG: efflux RND transporter periplasmic adaptor subunit [Pseudomonadota bacterium]
MVVERGDNVLRRQFFGKVVARQTVDLALQVSGQLLEFPVIEGALVSEGSLIAQLDLEPFQRALDTAIVQRDQAERVLNRLQQLSSSTASQASIDDAQSAFDLAAIAVRDAEFALNNATLEAPFDGLVAARNVANFTTVQAGAPIVRLHDVGEWRVEIDVPEVLFRTVGESPDFTIYATFTGSDRQIPLDLREFNAEASAIGQTFNITLAMLEEPGPGVLPGTSVTVVADRQVNETAVEIPASAIQIADDGSQAVLVFEPDGSGDMGTIRRQPVTFEASADGEFLLGDELEDGTEIVVAGVNRLEDGQQVRRFTGFSN